MNDILKISKSCQEISFLSTFSIRVSMLLSPTDLIETSEDIMRAFSSLSRGLKKIILSYIFQKVWKVFIRIFNIYFSLRSNGRKILLKTLAISTEFMIVHLHLKFLEYLMDLILNIDFIPFQVFLMLFQLISK